MEFREQQPIYLQIVDYVCEQILLKHWGNGDRIPSVRELAITLEVNPNTVMRSYEFLQQEQVVFNRRGLGLFVADDGLKKALEYRQKIFMEREVPVFFASMSLLNISIEELGVLYRKHKRLKV